MCLKIRLCGKEYAFTLVLHSTLRNFGNELKPMFIAKLNLSYSWISSRLSLALHQLFVFAWRLDWCTRLFLYLVTDQRYRLVNRRGMKLIWTAGIQMKWRCHIAVVLAVEAIVNFSPKCFSGLHSGWSRPWAKGGGGGGGLIYLSCWLFSLLSFLLVLPKIRGRGRANWAMKTHMLAAGQRWTR